MSAPTPNTGNFPPCPTSKRSITEPSQNDDIEDNAAGSMRWFSVGTFLILGLVVLLI
jgi:hypothetical protein